MANPAVEESPTARDAPADARERRTRRHDETSTGRPSDGLRQRTRGATTTSEGAATGRTPKDRSTGGKGDAPGTGGMGARVKALGAWVQRQKPVRVFQHYGAGRGPILASGLAYQALFAGFAAIWVGFSIVGLAAGNTALQQSIISTLSSTVPGLIRSGGSSGAIDPKDLMQAGIYGWTGAIALVGLLWTALGWLASARDAIRTLFRLGSAQKSFVLLKLKDLGLAVGFGAAVLVSSLLSVAGTQATGALLDLIGVGSDSVAGTIVGRGVTVLVMLALDSAVLGLLYRVLTGLKIPGRHLRTGTLLGAVGLVVLQVLGSALIGNAGSSNPLLASFGVILGLLVFFNLICQVVLIGASWIAVTVADAGVVVDEAAERKRLEDARRLVAEHDGPQQERRGFFARLFGHRARTTGDREAGDRKAGDREAGDRKAGQREARAREDGGSRRKGREEGDDRVAEGRHRRR